LTTDAEMDSRLLGQAEPYLARAYRLHFEAEGQETTVTSLHNPPENGLVLYRGETSGAVGFDVHGGFGRTWTTGPEHASDYGTVRQAVLPASAKRLVLCDPADGEFNWAGIEELQRITGDYSIVPAIKAQRHLFDLWQDEWTYKLQQAGYASIATYNIEGPEEYVLNDSQLIPLVQNNGTSNHAGTGHQPAGKKRKNHV
jgi:hypothetical protein